jgi:heme/copper-type cytochrome/quinol oxidase subunit 2
MTVRTRVMMTTVVVLVVGGLATLLPLVAGSPEPREIVVVARRMAFYVGDGVTTNPTIHAAPGERIRVTLVSQDPGFDHDFAVPAWRVNSAVLHGEGRNSTVIQVPDKPGVTTYVCSKHASMMKGIIEVSDPSATRVPEK